MSDKNWQRARSGRQVKQRENEILTGAEKLFLSVPYEKITMQMIAREAHFTQSNLYRYFKTKEEIFLKIFITDMQQLAAEVTEVFTTELSIEDFSAKWADILMRQKRFLELSPLFAVTLEKNTSEDVYRWAKRAIADQSTIIIKALQKTLPCLREDQIMNFLITNQALIAGAWPLSHFNEMQLKIIDELNIPQVKVDFRPYYTNAIMTYLRGLCASAKSK